MSILGLPATPVEFWLRHRDEPWPMCDQGPCQLPALLTEKSGTVVRPRCAHHGQDKPRWFIEPADLVGTQTTTLVRPRR